MDNENLNTDVRTHIEPEAVNRVEKNGYKQIKDLMSTVHGYCMDYTKLSFDFIHDNKDLVKDVVKVGCKTAMVVTVAAASVAIAKAISESQK